MKIVDKYGLAEQPYGTVFYEVIDQDIKSGPKILRSHTFYSHTFYGSYKGKPMFNGVQYLEPNSFLFTGKDIKVGLELPLTPVDNEDSEDPNWFAVDDDSNDYEDDDMFLVLSKEETVDLIKMMIKFTGTQEYFGTSDSDEEPTKN